MPVQPFECGHENDEFNPPLQTCIILLPEGMDSSTGA